MGRERKRKDAKENVKNLFLLVCQLTWPKQNQTESKENGHFVRVNTSAWFIIVDLSV